MKTYFFFLSILLSFWSFLSYAQQDSVMNSRQSLTDMDGNVYAIATLKDGRTWMTQNLNLKIKDSYCYKNNPINCEQYGRLYTWEAAKAACKLLGDDWRLPTDGEFLNLASLYGGVDTNVGDRGENAYKALIKGGSSGFEAVFAGSQDSFESFFHKDQFGYYWTQTEDAFKTDEFAYSFLFRKDFPRLSQEPGDTTWSLSCRCILEQK